MPSIASGMVSAHPQMTAEIMARTGLDEEQLTELVHRFYARVRTDAILAPIFAARISDWAPHLERMMAFWSSVALSTGRYHGAPVPAHLGLPVRWSHFERWLTLFRETAAEICSPEGAAHVIECAERIARSLNMAIENAKPGSVPSLLRQEETDMTRPLPPQDPVELTRFIEAEYHARHRAQLPALASLSEKVETVHAGQAGVPAGLAELLRRMIGELEVHMKKEELILFPAIRKATPGLDTPIAAMRADHDDHEAEVERITQLTGGLTLPEGACNSWTRLYAEIGEFLDDLREHIRLENDVLFPQFEAQGAENA